MSPLELIVRLPATAGTPLTGQEAKVPSLMTALAAMSSNARATNCFFMIIIMW